MNRSFGNLDKRETNILDMPPVKSMPSLRILLHIYPSMRKYIRKYTSFSFLYDQLQSHS